jgi:RNA polymerase sigma-70 factor (ECF subfamily)
MARNPPPDWQELDERELKRLFRGEDEDTARGALVELLRRHHDELRIHAGRLCGGNADLRDEVRQQLDVRLWEKRKGYDPGKGIWKAWAKRILERLVIDAFRDRARCPRAPAAQPADPDSPPLDPVEQLPGREPAVDWPSRLEELREAMADCLGRLPTEERSALVLQVLEGRTIDEIAAEASSPSGTAGTRVYRAKQKLRECLRRKGYEGGEV